MRHARPFGSVRPPFCCLTILCLVAVFAQTAAAQQQDKHFEKEITVKVKLDYLLYLPAGYDEKPDQKWPLILFLHGSGERGEELAKVKIHGPPKIVEAKTDFPFVVVSPQARRRRWNPDALKALLDEVLARYRVDPDRVYLTGLSMGGSGTWALAAEYPEYFAAAVPICGHGDPQDARRLKDLPIWVFHGAKDEAVPLGYSEEMVKALEEEGAEVKFTVYPEAEHDSWTETYNNPELYQWLLSHRRGEKGAAGS
ncbi:MAG TPA: prolyl oligopeptidase family serine peptidase [Pirellulales bacterium]|nr:prolyl oligopeptidase family serine peptidase [Pirellulales bacterium]